MVGEGLLQGAALFLAERCEQGVVHGVVGDTDIVEALGVADAMDGTVGRHLAARTFS